MISHMLHRRDADQAPIIATDMPLAEQIIVWCVYVVYLFFFCFKPNILGLGRPLITLIGASVVVLVRDLSGTPADLTALHYDVLLYLFGLMLFSHYMTLTGVMRVPMRLFSLTYARFGSHGLLWALSLCTGIIAMFFTNDMAVFLLTPVTVKMCASLMPDAGRRVVFLFLMALSTTANVASAMSPIGNPQNVLVATLSGIAPGVFWRFLSLGTVICWVLNTAALSTWLYFVERRKSTSSSADGAKHVALEMSSYERVESQDGALSDAESDANTIIFNEELSEIVFSSRTLNILSCITVTVLVGWVILVSIADVYLGWTTVLAALIIVVAHTAATRMVAGANTGAAAAQAAGVTVFADARVVDFGLLFMFWGNFVLIASLLDTGWPQAVFDALIAAVGDSIVQLVRGGNKGKVKFLCHFGSFCVNLSHFCVNLCIFCALFCGHFL